MIPSRHSNPFATCWTRPGAVPFLFAGGLSADALIARLASQNWRGQIIGPHGSGKSTLLATLQPLLEASERSVQVIDGFEELGRFERWRLRRACHGAHLGLLVTAHRSVGLPTLIEIAPNCCLVHQLVANLCGSTATPISPTDVDASIARHGSNVREILFDLYDRHERLSGNGSNGSSRLVVAIAGRARP